jgi:guanylate kinase
MQKAIIITAPSGAGKTTLVKKILKQRKDLAFSVSACTRDRRLNEIHGRDYYFLHPGVFKQKIEDNEFIEWEEVYQDMFYGTLKSEIERIWMKNKAVIFDIDVKGAVNIKKQLGDQALAIFIAPPSSEVLKARLKARGTESEESLNVRFNKSLEELAYQDQMDEIVINDDLVISTRELNERIARFLM